MPPELQESLTRLGNFCYIGQRELRRAFTEFFRFLFTELDLTKDFRWGENDSKITIDSWYPEANLQYPRIIVESATMDISQLSLKDVSKRNTETGDLIYSGAHQYTITVRVRDYEPDPVEKILDMLLLLLSVNEVRDNFAKLYKCFIDISRKITVMNITAVPIPGTQRVGFEGAFRFYVFSQWEITLAAVDVETIASEAVLTTVQDP